MAGGIAGLVGPETEKIVMTRPRDKMAVCLAASLPGQYDSRGGTGIDQAGHIQPDTRPGIKQSQGIAAGDGQGADGQIAAPVGRER